MIRRGFSAMKHLQAKEIAAVIAEADRFAEEATLHYEQVDGRKCGEYTVLIAG